MALSPGDRLGSYKILSPLGAGGMGEVYRARDAKLNREVAIKVLPPGLAHDADYIARFQREAQTLASLNHPNIAAIYGLEGDAIVMELVEGETLRGPLPMPEALAVARQIAEGLEAAHEKGIIHRDLKPGNVKVTPEGVVKVLDFGLAKTFEGPISSGADSPTLTIRATEAGLILGTAAYMSPEQAAGKPVDRRADIWSFGVVLYELITGDRLFEGETVSHTLAHVLTREIDLDDVPAGPIRELVRRCLDRNLKRRLSHIAEARIAIDDYAANPVSAATAPRSRPTFWMAATAVCLVAALAGWGLWMKKPATPAVTASLELLPPQGTRFADIGNTSGSAISPDGRTLAFIATNGKGETQLYVRPLESLEARALPGTDDAGRPFWSPDGKALGFVGRGKLKRVDIAGGAPVSLCDARRPRGGTWREDGVILFGDQEVGLQRIPATGGTPSPVTQVNREAGEVGHAYPQLLPGGKQYLYLIRHSVADKTGIYLGSLDGKSPLQVAKTEYNAAYDAASERLMYLTATGRLVAQRLELNPPRLAGEPSVVAERVRFVPANGYAEYSISGNGTLFYRRFGGNVPVRFVWKDRTGRVLEAVSQPEYASNMFALSPGGDRVAYGKLASTQPDIWVMELARGLSNRITFSGAIDARWSPDGRQIYSVTPGGISRKSAEGAGDEELLLKAGSNNRIQSVSPDNTHLLYGAGQIMLLPLKGDRKPESFIQSDYAVFGAAFSPDGRWVAFESEESGRREIYVQGFPDRRGKWMVSAAGGQFAAWRGDGKELYWVGLDSVLMATGVELQASGVKPGRPEPLFRLPSSRQGFAPSRDGRRFLVQEPEGEAKELPMVVVQNWAARLGR